MRRQIKNITLTPSQEAYVRGNYKRMTTAEMGANLKISQSKVFENMNLMGLKRPEIKRYKRPVFETKAGFFNPEGYKKLATI